MHGYKGYKDWGAWNLLEEGFVKAGFGIVKFNVSHNGGTVDDPIDFPDLVAFGHNRYTYELKDLEVIVNETNRIIKEELQLQIPIYLLGHSRGGGVCILYAAKDSRIKKLISLAGISNIESRWPDEEGLKKWQEEGVMYVPNARTNQNMPHFYGFYQDYVEHREELDIEAAARSLKIPFLQIHGDMDEAVSISEGQQLAKWTRTRVFIVKGAGHTFETSHPWNKDELPYEMKKVLDEGIRFFGGVN